MTPLEDNDNGQIDLGEGPEDNGMNAPMGAAPEAPRPPSYPTVMLSGGADLHRMADVGHHVIKGKVIAKHMPHRGSKHHKVELEIHSIKPQMRRGRPTSNHADEDATHIKKLMERSS